MKILIADDSYENAEVLRILLDHVDLLKNSTNVKLTKFELL